ncbi:MULTISPECIES: GtrA family protein [Rhizobium]|uniref:GtrA family protein n=1 Tax=Rhizobium TaxID=379 RepID=UPI001B3244ED|nr:MULTISPECIES: GtrA family protein [Rhizobium]MBX4907836.1 GtrA family protein [Rhizobium bangladeshense]MBX5215602.1 GtrA family protein [Rhizobium sp. NLR9a]MBX5221461.1 GtrA family protein [Rhizobium sp. NLR8a]MBX5226923.1 GtrA family protein [Rhizobium sp. NLR9b]MBX5232765.1 GtrA family protein [Rhizobium sp. NLR4a]
MARQSSERSTSAGLATRYLAFAMLSTAANFAVQATVMQLAPSPNLMPSMLAGTAAGFGLKYLLDKKWIFFDGYTSHGDEMLKVALYGLFSVLTTLIFWGFEITFWTVWKTELAKYTGGALGLAIGYISKYALDRKFVFKPEEA